MRLGEGPHCIPRIGETKNDRAGREREGPTLSGAPRSSPCATGPPPRHRPKATRQLHTARPPRAVSRARRVLLPAPVRLAGVDTATGCRPRQGVSLGLFRRVCAGRGAGEGGARAVVCGGSGGTQRRVAHARKHGVLRWYYSTATYQRCCSRCRRSAASSLMPVVVVGPVVVVVRPLVVGPLVVGPVVVVLRGGRKGVEKGGAAERRDEGKRRGGRGLRAGRRWRQAGVVALGTRRHERCAPTPPLRPQPSRPPMHARCSTGCPSSARRTRPARTPPRPAAGSARPSRSAR